MIKTKFHAGLFLFFILGTSTQAAVPFYLARVHKANYAEKEILIKYKNKNTITQLRTIGAKKIKNLNKKGLMRVRIPESEAVETLVEKLKRDPNVEIAQPNYIYHITSTPNDTNFSQLWGLKNTGQTIVAANGPDIPDPSNNPGTSGKDMNLVSAWDHITDCSSATVAVIDTGVNYNHSDLSTNMWNGGVSYPNHGYDFVDSDNDPMDVNGHGTHVAGTIGAIGNNNLGITGICWNASIMALRVGDAAGAIYSSSVVQALDFAADNGAKVINMSLGGASYDGAFDTAVTDVVNRGLVVVVAAGNDGEDNDSGTTPSYPCNFTQANLLCVAALEQNYSLASFSNYGNSSVDVGAPGVNITNLWPGTHTENIDTLTSGWTMTSTTMGDGWGYKSYPSGIVALVNPASFDRSVAKYKNSTDDRAWKTFNIAGSTAAVLKFSILTDTESTNDPVNIYVKNAASDPTIGGTLLDIFSGTTNGYIYPVEYEISNFASANTSIGFNLTSNASTNDFGALIYDFSIRTLTLNNNTYNVLEGTSMATPHVAGLAAMIFAYNPNFTATEVVNAIKAGGINESALANNTTTGKAANAMGSLSFIKAPTGLNVVKE